MPSIWCVFSIKRSNYYILACPGVNVVAKNGEKKCYVVFSGIQMTRDKAFTYYEARQFCYSMGGQLPTIKNADEQKNLLEAINKYQTDPVSSKLLAHS